MKDYVTNVKPGRLKSDNCVSSPKRIKKLQKCNPRSSNSALIIKERTWKGSERERERDRRRNEMSKV